MGIRYEKPGKYGDAKQVQFQFVPKEQNALIERAVDTLEPGDKVMLEWQHNYVTKESCTGGTTQYPERSVLELSQIPKAFLIDRRGRVHVNAAFGTFKYSFRLTWARMVPKSAQSWCTSHLSHVLCINPATIWIV